MVFFDIQHPPEIDLFCFNDKIPWNFQQVVRLQGWGKAKTFVVLEGFDGRLEQKFISCLNPLI